jgi:hypothetical protein
VSDLIVKAAGNAATTAAAKLVWARTIAKRLYRDS